MPRYIIFTSGNGHWTITQRRKKFNLLGADGYMIVIDLCCKQTMVLSSSFFVDELVTEDQIKKEVEAYIPILFKSLADKANKLKGEAESLKYQRI